MKGSLKIISLMAVISLLIGVIWLPLSFAATAPTFAPLGMLGTKGQDYGSPMGIAMDAAGNFYVADGSGTLSPGGTPSDKIVKLDTYGNKVAEFASLELSGPIAVKGDGSEIYVAVGQSFIGHGVPGVDSVLVYDGVTGAQKRSIVGEFRKVTDLKLDSNGWLYVADSGVVKVYDANETLQGTIGVPCVGNGNSDACEAGEFSSVTSIALDEASGEFFAADLGSGAYTPTGTDIGNIQVFDLATGAYKRVMLEAQMGGPIDASTNTAFDKYSGLVVDGQGRFYATCGQLGILRAMDTSIVYPTNAFLAGFDLGSAAYRSVYDSANRRLVFSGDQGLIVVGIDGGSNPVALNDAPPVPTQVSPVADTVVATAAPTLDFSAVTDPNGDTVSYQVSLAQVGQAAIVYDVPAGTTSYVAGGLVENAQYVWKVQAVDAKGAVSGWSAGGTFWVNAVNEAPSVPQMVLPLNGEQLGPWKMLQWMVATDPDPGDKVRYLLSMSPSADFSGPVLKEVRWGSAVRLNKLKHYLDLVAGVTYFWRLEAIDGIGGRSLPSGSGAFVLKATDLRVDTNVPGTKVYLGGNHTVHGQYLGVTPLVVRNLEPVGMNDLVLERAGFESIVSPVYLKRWSAKTFSYQLQPALQPVVGTVFGYTFYYREPDSTGKFSSFFLGTHVLDLRSAFFVNLDRRGRIDLVAGKEDGSVVFFSNVKKIDLWGRARVRVGAPQLLLPSGSATSIYLVDWENNGTIDLLAGGNDGRLRVFYNPRRGGIPAYSPVPSVLQAGGQDLVFAANPVPVVIDWDGDGLNDVLVGDDSGKLSYVKNIGTLSNPVFAAPVVVFQSKFPIAPCLVDWDGDGDKEILLVDDKGISLYEIQGGGLVYVETLLLQFKDGRAFVAKPDTRIFALDLDGAGGKDLVIVDGVGRFMVGFSNGTQHVASFKPALLAKTDQVRALVDAQAPALLSQVDAVYSAIQTAQNDDYAAARLEVNNLLLAGLDPAGSAYAAASELKQLLQ